MCPYWTPNWAIVFLAGIPGLLQIPFKLLKRTILKLYVILDMLVVSKHVWFEQVLRALPAETMVDGLPRVSSYACANFRHMTS